MNEIKDLFDIDWLDEWKQMMCRKMFNDDRGEYCIRPVEVFPCKDCRFNVTVKSHSKVGAQVERQN